MLLMVVAHFFLGASARAADWKAGVATTKITPTEFIWMAGYAARDKPASGTLNDLWAKALVLQDADGRRAVLVSLDLLGLDRDTSDRIRDRLAKELKLPREAVALCCTHTHSGPAIGTNLRVAYSFGGNMTKKVSAYTDTMIDAVVASVAKAAEALKPAVVKHGVGRATFAVNRRQNKEPAVEKLSTAGGNADEWRRTLAGPVDHDLPVLAVFDEAHKPLAVVFGYACHATTLAGYDWSSDWPGFAAEAITATTGAPAFFVAGCGGDQNPLPRRKVEYAQAFGQEIARGVADVLARPMDTVAPKLTLQYAEIALRFATLPTRDELQAQSASKDPKQRYVARRAALLLERITRDGGLPQSYPYPLQTWALGDRGPRMVFLGGEVVVDYALRLKKELGHGTWPVAYANDVMAYIPSRRVLAEGGYEGGGAMVYYGLPTVWAPEVEDVIITEAKRQAK